MAQLEVIALDTATPQLRAPGGSDTYLMPKDLTVQSTVNATNVEVTNVKAKDGTAAITISDTSGNVGLSANLNFSGTGQRITGDMSNATVANRLMFQGSVSNATTFVGLIPNGTGTTSSVNCFGNSDPTNAPFIRLLQNSTNDSQIRSDITGTGTYVPMTFHTNGSERMRLDTSGNLGIGTASPGYKFDVVKGSVGDVARFTNGVDASLIVGAPTGGITYNQLNGGYQSWQIASSEKMRLDSSGNVGIGTASPVAGYRLNVVNDSGNAQQLIRAGTNFNSTIAFGDQDSSTSGQLIYAHNGDYMAFNTNAAERMRIDSSGNVGIGGAASALAKLHLLGTYPTSGNSTVVTRVTGTIPSGSTSSAIIFQSNPTTEAASFTLSSLSHFYAAQQTLGAGSTVTNQYGFNALSTLTGATNNYGVYSNIASGSNRWNFYAAGTAQNYMAGNLLLGVSSPGYTSRFVSRGATSDSTAWHIYGETSAGTYTLSVRNDGKFYTGIAASSPYNDTTANAANVVVDSAGLLQRSTSSLRYKSNVVDATHGLVDVLKLRSVTYKGKNDGDKILGGLIAEEVHDAGLTEFVAYDNEGRPDALHYGNMVALLVKAVQELKAELDTLKGNV